MEEQIHKKSKVNPEDMKDFIHEKFKNLKDFKNSDISSETYKIEVCKFLIIAY